MTPPAHSRSYKLAKWQLTHRYSKYSIWFSIVLSLFWFGMALLPGTTFSRTTSLIAGVISLFGAYFEWVRKGYLEIIEEQAKLLEEARAAAK